MSSKQSPAGTVGTEAYKKYRASEKYRRTTVNSHLKRTYGITLQEYEIMLELQDHKCKICFSESLNRQWKDGRQSRMPFFVDHCHETGKVRGLLCNKCNVGIAMFNEELDLLTNAINYLIESKKEDQKISSTTFVNGVTLTDQDWFNDTNDVAYDILGNGVSVPTTKASARSNLTLSTLTTDATPDATADWVETYDTSASTSKKVQLNNLAKLSPITASLGGNIALNNTALYFDGPSIAQGTTGTWFASGTVSLVDTASAAQFLVKLWDGTSVIAAGILQTPGAGSFGAVHVSGFIVNPVGNIRISVRDQTATTGSIQFNVGGNSKDATVSAIRVA